MEAICEQNDAYVNAQGQSIELAIYLLSIFNADLILGAD